MVNAEQERRVESGDRLFIEIQLDMKKNHVWKIITEYLSMSEKYAEPPRVSSR